MKLSEMSTEKAAEAMAALAAPLGNLAKNEALTTWLKNHGSTELGLEAMLQIVIGLLPVFLRDNFADTVQIVAILAGKKPKEIKEQGILQTIRDVRDCFDEDLGSFFQ